MSWHERRTLCVGPGVSATGLCPRKYGSIRRRILNKICDNYLDKHRSVGVIPCFMEMAAKPNVDYATWTGVGTNKDIFLFGALFLSV